MSYKIIYQRKAVKKIRKLPKSVQDFITKKLKELAEMDDPLSHNKLTELKMYNYCRYRVGDYRIFLTIEKKVITIYIFDLDHRKDSYK